MKKYMILLLVFGLMLLAGCQGQVEDPEVAEEPVEEEVSEAPVETYDGPNPKVTIVMADGNEIVLELMPSEAPNTVNNFISLAQKGFYDGLIFHRIIEGFMIQGGDPDGLGTGGPGYSITGEFAENGVDNTISHEPGVISMARSKDFDSAGSQFFIVHGDATFLDGQYAGFGKVVEGFEYVEQYAVVETAKYDKPVEDVVIDTVLVDLNGYEFMEPIIIKE